MKLINRYVLKQIAIYFVVVLSSLITLIWLTQSLKLIDMIVTKGVPARVFLEMTVLALPNFLQILFPIALFAVVLFVFVRMQADKELMVMQAVGLSYKQQIFPLVCCACFLTVIGYFLTLWVVPNSYAKLRELKWKVQHNISHLLLQEGQFNTFSGTLTLYTKERLPDGSFAGIFVQNSKNPKRIETMVAQKAEVFQEEEGMRLVFFNGIRQEYNPKEKQFSFLKFKKYTMLMAENGANARVKKNAREMSLTQLLSAKRTDSLKGNTYQKYKVEAFKRLTQPLYNISFVLIAAFGLLFGFYNRRGQAKQIYTVIGIVLLTQSFALLFENLANHNLWYLIFMGGNIFVPVLLTYLFFKNRPIKKKRKKFKLLLLGFVLFLWSGAVQAALGDKDVPVDFESDTVVFDKNTNQLMATGNVIVSQEGTRIETEKIIYSKEKDKIDIPQFATIYSTDGTVTTVHSAQLSSDIKEGTAKDITMRFKDGATAAAGSLFRKNNGANNVLRKVFYTPCQFCKNEEPVWKISSLKMNHYTEDKTIAYWHNFFEIKGIPVFYLPYLSLPDFSVKRKTGFLPPSISHSSVMGSGIETPFFINVADNQNLLLRPTFSVSHAPLGVLDYKGLFRKGLLHLQGSVTKDSGGGSNKAAGHIKSLFEYDIDSNWRLKGQLFRVSNDTYFRRYDIPAVDETQPALTSEIGLERFSGNSYFTTKGLYFQNLQSNVSRNATPIAFPVLDFHYQTNVLNKTGMYLFSDVGMAAIRTKAHLHSNRISATQGVRIPYVTDFGMGIDFIGTVRMDGYNIETGMERIDNLSANRSYNTGRFYPEASIEFNYPFSKTTENTTQIIEPIIMLVTAPSKVGNTKIPDLDSIDFDFDDTNLFSRNRFSGYDRVETGTRANYGVQWSLFDTKNRSISALFGQSYRFNKDEEMNRLMGMEDNFSDYIGRIQIGYKEFLLSYRFRLDSDTLAAKKNEITVEGGPSWLRLGVDYSYIADNKDIERSYPTREEALIYGKVVLNKSWSLSGKYRYDLTKDGGPLEFGTILRYDNECLAVLLDFNKAFTKDRNYHGGTSVGLRFELKTTGGVL